MDFWETFQEECLQRPWTIRPQVVASQQKLQIETEHIFVVQPQLPDEAYTMLSKMMAALNYQSTQVTILSLYPDQVESLQTIDDPKGIIFFGDTFPGSLGDLRNWFGHQYLKTYSLETLLNQPQYKRETWQHLKSYAGRS